MGGDGPHGGIHNMNIKSNEKKENSTIELVIQVGADEFNAAIDKVYNRQKKNITLPGFRKGKAPRKMVEAMYGAEVFYEDAIEEAYPAAYSAALEEAGIEPVAYPKLEIQEVGKDGFTFKAVVTVKPEVKVKDYKGMTAPKADVQVTDADVKAELKTYIDRASPAGDRRPGGQEGRHCGHRLRGLQGWRRFRRRQGRELQPGAGLRLLRSRL